MRTCAWTKSLIPYTSIYVYFPTCVVYLYTEEVATAFNFLGSTGRKAVALYPYAASKSDELTFTAGQIIDLISTPEEGWWEGRINDQFGWFPTPYVQEFQGEPPLIPEGVCMCM